MGERWGVLIEGGNGGYKQKADTFFSKISISLWGLVRETVFLRIGVYFNSIIFQDTLNGLVNRHLFNSCDFQCSNKHMVFEQWNIIFLGYANVLIRFCFFYCHTIKGLKVWFPVFTEEEPWFQIIIKATFSFISYRNQQEFRPIAEYSSELR